MRIPKEGKKKDDKEWEMGALDLGSQAQPPLLPLPFRPLFLTLLSRNGGGNDNNILPPHLLTYSRPHLTAA